VKSLLGNPVLGITLINDFTLTLTSSWEGIETLYKLKPNASSPILSHLIKVSQYSLTSSSIPIG